MTRRGPGPADSKARPPGSAASDGPALGRTVSESL